jgi:DNA repair exonuclease SbcCD nuclease subunit
MIRIICTADNHLGRYYGKMTLKQLAERRAGLRDLLRLAKIKRGEKSAAEVERSSVT